MTTPDPVRLFFTVTTLEPAAGMHPGRGGMNDVPGMSLAAPGDSFRGEPVRLVSRTGAPVEIPAGVLLRDIEIRTGGGDLLGRVRVDDEARAITSRWEHEAAFREGVAEGRRRERRRIRKRLRKVAGL